MSEPVERRGLWLARTERWAREYPVLYMIAVLIFFVVVGAVVTLGFGGRFTWVQVVVPVIVWIPVTWFAYRRTQRVRRW